MPRIVGIDFSGGRDAGRHIWIAEGVTRPSAPTAGPVLDIVSLRPLRVLANGQTAPELALPVLVDHLAVLGDAVVAIDAPFSLPEALMHPARTWMDWLGRFAGRYSDADAFRNDMRRQADGRELRRRCDNEARTPFCAYNLRLYRQTYWVLTGLVWPLVRDGRCTVAPMLPGDRGPVLAEACPASFLKHRRINRRYKGPAPDLADARAAICAHLARLQVRLDDDARHTVQADRHGDALDAVICATILFETWRANVVDWHHPRDRRDALEGRVYF